MSKHKSKQKIKVTDTKRFILQKGDSIKLTNKTELELLVTTFPSLHHE